MNYLEAAASRFTKSVTDLHKNFILIPVIQTSFHYSVNEVDLHSIIIAEHLLHATGTFLL